MNQNLRKKMFNIKDDDFNAIANYLVERPYKEVAGLIEALRRAEQISEPLEEVEPEPELEVNNDAE